MTKNENGTETGFGIGTKLHGDLDYSLLKVDIKKKKIEEVGNKFWSFEEFIKEDFTL